jgi:hypothetical protein
MPDRCFEVGNDDGAGAVLFNQVHGTDDGMGMPGRVKLNASSMARMVKLSSGSLLYHAVRRSRHTSTGI